MNLIKKNISKKKTLVLSIIIAAIFIRFYNFENRINFGPEQAISLIVAGDYIKDKPTLLGLPSTQRFTSNGHIIFSGAFFTYTLVPLLLLFNYDPTPITAVFAFINVLSGLILFLVVNRYINFRVALFSLILFLFNSYMIYHSMFIWIVNYLPLFGILIGIFLYKFHKTKKNIYSFLVGLISSLSFGMEYMFLFTIIIIFGLLIFMSPKKMVIFLIFISGAILGSLPMIVFDLRHDFYHLRVFIQYGLDTLNNPRQGVTDFYHFLHFWPLLMLLLAIFLNAIYSYSRFLAVATLILYLSVNLISDKISFTSAIGMQQGMNINSFKQAAKAISEDNPDNFNVAALLDFDSRAHPIRYLLKFVHNSPPKGIEEYSNISTLYVFAEKGYDFDRALAWEIKVHRPFDIKTLKDINQKYKVYKLNKQNE